MIQQAPLNVITVSQATKTDKDKQKAKDTLKGGWL